MQQSWKKNTAIFMTSQALSIFGSSLVQFAITWYITLKTQSGLYTTLMIVCGFVPTLFLAPFAGVWADRYDRKKLIMLADGGIALCTLVLAILFMLGYNAIWLLFVAAGIRALGSAVQSPCINAMLPDLVPEEQLTRVNGINGSLHSLITLISPMVSGALMGFASLETIFFIDVTTAAIAIGVMLVFLKLPKKVKAENQAAADYMGELKEGFRYILDQKFLRNIFVFCAVFYLLAAPTAFLTPLQTTRTFGGDVWRLTAVELTFSVGMLIGGLVIAAWGGFKNKVHTMTFAGVFMSVTVIGMGLPRYFWLYLVFMGLCGLAMPIFNTPAVVMLQERVDPNYMGRVFSVLTMLSSCLMPLGMLVFGPLADVVPIEWLLVITGVLLVVLTISLTLNKPLLQAGEPKMAAAQE